MMASDISILFVHGFMGSGDDWTPLRDALPSSIHSRAMDLPGHGSNRALRPESGASWLSVCIGSIARAFAAARSDRTVAAGYSLGGRLLLHAIREGQLAPDAVILLSANPGIADPEQRQQRLVKDRETAQAMRTLPPEAFLAGWYRQDVFSSLENKPALRQSMIARRTDNDFPVLADLLEALSPGRVPCTREVVHQLQIPCMFVAGENDNGYVGYVRELERMNPSVRGVIVPSAGHAVHREQPEQTAAEIERFLIGR